MKKIVWLLVLLGVYYAHSRFAFAQPRVESWLLHTNMAALTGDGKACEAYADDVDVQLIADNSRGRWEVEGGKAELCDYLKKTSAALVLLDASTNFRLENTSVQRAGFPWLTAQVSYTHVGTIQAAALPRPVPFESVDQVTLRRTLTGLQIVKLASQAKGGLQ
jgi:hypothetical protein